MMEDQFDTLLDFGDSTGTSTTNGTAAHDPNDPFSSPTKPVSDGALLDFSFDPFAQDVNGTSKSHDQNTNPFGDDPFGLNSAPNSNFDDGGFQSGNLLGGSLEAEFAASFSSIKTAETREADFAQEENNHGEEIPESNDFLAPETNNVHELESPVTPGTEEPSEGFSEEAGDYRDEQYEDLRNEYKEEQFEEYITEPQETNEEEHEYRQEELSPEPQQEYQEPEQEYQEPEQEYQEPEQDYQEPEPEYRKPEPEYHEPEQEYREPEPEYQDEQQSPADYHEEQEAQPQEDYRQEHEVEQVDYQEDTPQEYTEESRDQFQQQEDYEPEELEQEPYSPVRDEDNFLGQIEEIERMATQLSTPESPMSPVHEVTTPSSDDVVISEQVATHVTEDGDTRTVVTETVKEVHEGGKTIIQTEVVTETHTENAVENDEQHDNEEEPQKMEPDENDVGYENEERRSSKSLIRAFEMEKQDYQPPKRVTKTETDKDSKSAIFIANSQEGSDQNTCTVCAKRVYEMEKLIANHAVYHKTCFKCTKCKRTLGVGNYSVNEGNLYCKPHFMELFRLRGHYEDRHKGQSKDTSPVNGTGNGTVSIDDGGDTPLPEVIRPSEDNREEEIQSLPSLRNIKSRFENRDGEAPQKEVKQPGKIKVEWGASDMRQKEVSPSPPRDPDIFREQKVQTQEEVSYGGLTSIKSRYLESSSPVAPTQGPPPPKVIPRSEEPVQKAPSVSPPREAGVIRSDEPKDETEELPPQNITKGLLARFRDMESQSGNQPIKTTPAPRTDLIEADLTRPDQPAEAGEFESQPQFRDDVIREDDDNETEFLPASGNLKSRLAVFKQMEATNANQPSSTPSFGNQYSTRQSPSRMNGNPGNSHPGEVLREGEANPEEELPQVGAAKNMREKFQSLQQTDGAPANSGDKKAEHRFTPPRGSPEKQRPEVTSAGPPRQENITRSEDPLQQEPLPTQEILHTCLNHFRQMEEEAKIQKSREYSPGPKNTSVTNSFATEFHAGQKSAPPKPARTVLTSGVDSTVYNPAAPEGGEYENEPILRDDVIRESDHFEVQELPQEGQARKLREQYLAKVH